MTDVGSKCSQCEKPADVECIRCGRGFCEVHGEEEITGHLSKWDQRIGTCTKCNQSVCENCWLLEGDGLITCLVHHEDRPHD
jgi:hypothetical protein